MSALLVFASAFAITDWIAVATGVKKLEVLAKPTTLLLLLAWYTSTISMPSAPGLWFGAGLVFSLIGDIFLMFPATHFTKGLLTFLFAHIAYSVAFNLKGLVWGWAAAIAALAIVCCAAVYVRQLVRAQHARGMVVKLYPVLFYTTALSMMFWSTVTTALRAAWPLLASCFAITGGFLFCLSDGVVAWNRFVRPIHGGRVFDIIAYHLAQMSLSTSMLLAYGAIG